MTNTGKKLTEAEKIKVLKEAVPGLPHMDYSYAVKNFAKAADMVGFLTVKKQVYI